MEAEVLKPLPLRFTPVSACTSSAVAEPGRAVSLTRLRGVPVRRETEGQARAPLPEPPSADTPRDVSAPRARGPRCTPRPAACAPRTRSPPLPQACPSLPLAVMKGLCLALLTALLCSAPAYGLWCQDCTLTTNSSRCTLKKCLATDTVCASIRITDPSSSRKDHSVNKMCASSCDFVKRHFFSDYVMGFINSGILKVDVDCCEKDLCNGVSGAGGSPWALAGGLLLSLGPALLWAGP
ncbi:lymphocyte antigen 6H [Orycteropus afer afer]|uniref:Lymphocyte antigen 6H n=1 Tax=Orycteropus afer afer TaxID=1230840 RepID=A0A8B7B3P6_ORYAF|nr:lymphocyte antigen 6H [Orycteropus afer afer]